MAFTQRVLLGAAAALTIGLGACQGTGASFASLGGSPAGVPIVFESIDGPPAPVKTALAGELAAAAKNRQVEIAGAGAPARYRVRGYLSTETTAEGETTLAFVWDVFDAHKRRAKRLTGASPVQSAGADPWSDLDKGALTRLAAQSMDEIAGFLSTAPSDAGGNEPIVTAEGAAPVEPGLGFAPQ